MGSFRGKPPIGGRPAALPALANCGNAVHHSADAPEPRCAQQSLSSHAIASEPRRNGAHDERTPEPGAREAARQARRLIASANELLALAAELEDIARHGARQSAGNGTNPGADGCGQNGLADDVHWLRWARRIYRNRRARGGIFGDETLFGEPAWDILLDLFIAAKELKRVPVTSACIGAAVPTTTALRWLSVLEERGLIVREADPNDARRVFVRLSADAYGLMVRYFVRAAMGDADDTIEAARSGSRALERAWT